MNSWFHELETHEQTSRELNNLWTYKLMNKQAVHLIPYRLINSRTQKLKLILHVFEKEGMARNRLASLLSRLRM